MAKKSSYFIPETPEDKLYEALSYYYWGMTDLAKEMMADLVKEEIDGEKEVPSSKQTKAVNRDEATWDDIDYEEYIGADQSGVHPWDQWRCS